MKLLTTLMLLPVLPATANSQEFQSLFNGKDLAGWAGKSKFWSVKNGVIFGRTTKDKPTKGNSFLVWQGG
jgi:3-keto-disaccharide hydrolase